MWSSALKIRFVVLVPLPVLCQIVINSDYLRDLRILIAVIGKKDRVVVRRVSRQNCAPKRTLSLRQRWV